MSKKLSFTKIGKASGDIQSFCKVFGAIITTTNQKGKFTARMTKKAVQIFLVTGEDSLDAMMNAAEACNKKRSEVGK